MVYRVTEKPANGPWAGSRLVDTRLEIFENADDSASTTVIEDDGSGGSVIIEDGGGSVEVPIVDLPALGICLDGAENGDILVFDAVLNCYVPRQASEGGGDIKDDGTTPDDTPGGDGIDLDGGTF